VRLDKTEGYVVIEGRAYPAREIVEALAQSGYAELRAAGDSLLFGRRRITPIFKSRQERAMAALCHGSLAYCCPLSKRCADRDRALEMLGLTQDDYQRLKGDSHSQFIDASRGLPPHDEYRPQDAAGTRTVNRPSADWSYGSDEYRGDFDVLERTLQSKRLNSGQPDSPEARSSELGPSRDQRGKPFSDGRTSSIFDGDSEEDYRAEQRQSGSREKPSSTTCRSCPTESTEGLGSLFNQGELSPFMDDTRSEDSRRSFCFSCGRTLKEGTRVCPYCGSSR